MGVLRGPHLHLAKKVLLLLLVGRHRYRRGRRGHLVELLLLLRRRLRNTSGNG